jgi:hypothetical protein
MREMRRRRRSSLLLIAGCLVTLMIGVGATPALAASGDLLWDVRYSQPASFDAGTAVAASPDGSRVFVVGDLCTTDPVDVAKVAYDAATGAQVWAATFNGPGNYVDRGEAVAVSPDGSRVFVTVTSHYEGAFGSTVEGDVVTIAYDAASGGQLWVARHPDGDGASEGCCVVVSPDGTRVYVAGTFGGPNFSTDGLTIAYDAATGSHIWSRRYAAGTGFRDVAVSPNGNRVISVGAANFNDSKGSDFITVAHNASTGTKQWVRRNDSTVGGSDGGETATSVAVAPDNQTVFVTGEEADDRYATIAYAAGTGATRWRVRQADAGGTLFGTFVEVAPNGSRVFVAGTHDEPMDLPDSADDFLTIAYAPATGAQLWASSFDDDPGPLDQGVDQVVGLALFDSAKLFVVGVGCLRLDEKTCAGVDDAVFRTVSYNATTGAQRWTRAYDDGSGNEPSAVAARAGRVFVTGEGLGDILTVAYAA